MTTTNFVRPCPVCQSGNKQNIITIDFELFEKHPMNGGYEVVQCDNCGFVYADTPVTQNELDHYYTELSKYEDKTISTGGGYNQNDKDRLVETALFLEKHITDKNARILDLGCANGGLLRELKNLGFTNVIGIDPSSACCAITKEDVGCECYQYSLFDIPKSVGKFDVVILCHVLEHVLDVKQTITIINQLLNKDGYAYLECPNASYYYDVIHAPLQEFNTEHINHFTENAFRNLMGIHNYDTIITADKTMVIASGQDYHAVYGLFKKRSIQSAPYTIQFDTTIKNNITKYIEDSNVILDEINATISKLPTELPLGLFGIGQFAFKLLKTSAFVKGRKYKIFDNNRINAGKKINGVTILHGDEVVNEFRKEKFAIIITSLIYEMPIKKAIQQAFEKNGETVPEIIGFSRLLKPVK